MKQTAVEWFFRWFNDNPEATHKEYAEAFEQAKAMEKAQITQSFVGGADFKEMARNDNKRATAFADQYYRNNYK